MARRNLRQDFISVTLSPVVKLADHESRRKNWPIFQVEFSSTKIEAKTCPDREPSPALNQATFATKFLLPSPTSEPCMSTESQSITDAELLAALRKGDRDALATIVEQHQNSIFGYLRGRVFEVTDAEDLCQEVFLRCYSGRVKFERTTRIGPWLVGIARNVLREHVREIQRRREVTWVELCLELESLAESHHSEDDSAMRHLPECLDSLGQSSRQALEMHYRKGMRLAEIGEFLRRSEGAVKLLMYRARQALRHCLDRKKKSSDDE